MTGRSKRRPNDPIGCAQRSGAISLEQRWETGGQLVVSLTVTLVTCRNGMFWRTDSCGLKEPCSRWRHLANTSERSSRGGSRTITCYFKYLLQLLNKTTFKRVSLSLAIQILQLQVRVSVGLCKIFVLVAMRPRATITVAKQLSTCSGQFSLCFNCIYYLVKL